MQLNQREQMEKLNRYVKNSNKELSEIKKGLQKIYDHLSQKSDHKRLKKCEQLVEKLDDNQLVIAFCGQFSAGKSTLINELIGQEVLPSHPIPTSANIVKVKAARHPEVVVTFKDKGTVTFKGEGAFDSVEQYCMDGDSVDIVDIREPNEQLPKGVTLLDTPGIDSTEEAHRLATESHLHLADLVLYVMDYHHVESEINRKFIQKLNEQVKPTFLLINQIDKHIDTELPFSAYQEKISKSLHDHQLQCEGLFYTSSFAGDHQYNELDRLRDELNEVIADKEMMLAKSILTESFQMILEHIEWWSDHFQHRLEEYKEVLHPYQPNDFKEIKQQWETYKQQQVTAETLVQQFEEEFSEKLERILENANLMPYHTRHLARDYLESKQIGFKVKGFFSTARTRQAQDNRFQQFYQELSENATTYLDIHIRQLLFSHTKAYGLNDEALRISIHQFNVGLPDTVITNALSRGALFNHQYVLHFSQQVIQQVRSYYRTHALKKLAEASTYVRKHRAKRERDRVRKRDEFERKLLACEGTLEIEKKLDHTYEQFIDILFNKTDRPNKKHERTRQGSLKQQKFTSQSHKSSKKTQYAVNLTDYMNNDEGRKRTPDPKMYEKRDQVLAALEKTAQVVEGVKGFATARKDLIDRASRLRDHRFTVALFGAFSSGKSSFANALLGEELLPVSPNPTTAVINQISPPTADHPHKSVEVTFKCESELVKDINEVLSYAHQQVDSLEELFHLLQERSFVWQQTDDDQLHEDEETTKEDDRNEDPFELLDDRQWALLQALEAGYESMKASIGQSVEVSLEQFYELVKTEEKACYVEVVKVYYDCSLTRQGIILVDTPGADSINGRHTDLAFSYIKHSDAIVFVSYFNHAFSRADREFLIQLGRVKESFTHDKMYFIINAADLAHSVAEVDDVVAHIEKNLLTCGIRDARIFPVSSQLSLLAKKFQMDQLSENESLRYKRRVDPSYIEMGTAYAGMESFENDFYTNTIERLLQSSIYVSYHEIKTIKERLFLFIAMVNESEHIRVEKLNQVRKAYRHSLELVDEVDVEIEQKLVLQEIDELVFYVKQRVFYRYFDEYKRIFSPIRFEGEDFTKTLKRCVNEVIHFLAFDFVQEMRATSFRVEMFLKKTLEDMCERVGGRLQEVDPHLNVRPLRAFDVASPSFHEGFYEVNADFFKEELDQYSSTESFFLEKGNFALRDQLEEKLRPFADQYIHDCLHVLHEHYRDEFAKWVGELKKELHAQTMDYYVAQIEALSSQQDLASLHDKKRQIEECLKTRT
ncbi:dynamin family protein [Desertibacillus haloalkaliphilus]|uniref:dynamin family protein n=1 Tax=Desertibacillus haloalkaliphilus TaxID=1328930 RepID=UPI001C2676E1|nr:dynamin family protein [Desertibacillus haloalkaliphilus]MBU8907448.1 dynamin family protein [Desertibacillus haloalkaliphilus]